MPSVSISPAALDALKTREYRHDGTLVLLHCGTLPRDVYEEVDEVLKRLRGKWRGGKTGGHIFQQDVTVLLEAILSTGEMPPKNPLAYFPTPEAIVGLLVQAAGLDREEFLPQGGRILEPSAGSGAIVRQVLEELERLGRTDVTVDAVEIDPVNLAMLRKAGVNVVYAGDFLAWRPQNRYDLVLMNPPFNVENKRLTWLDHVEHARSMLTMNGYLHAIVPSRRGSWDYLSPREFRFWKDVASEDLPERAFADSGTSARTSLVEMRSDYDDELDFTRDGVQTFYDHWAKEQATVTYIGDCPLCERRLYDCSTGNDPAGRMGKHAPTRLEPDDHGFSAGAVVVACWYCAWNDSETYDLLMKKCREMWSAGPLFEVA